MIVDLFGRLNRFSKIPHLESIQKFVAENDSPNFPDGETEILGRELFVRVADYLPEAPETKKFEAHKIYADLQLVVRGEEVIQYSSEMDPKPVTAYDLKSDIWFFEDPKNISSLVVTPGEFAFFFPGELHRPGCPTIHSSAKVKKLVFKIKMAKA